MATAIRGAAVPRFRASFIHLLLSAAVVGTALFVVFKFWYPWPFSYTNQIHFVVKVLIAVDIVLGPLLTFVVFNENKPAKELRRDLAIIGLIQVAALCYGIYALYSERPGYIAYLGDRFEVVPAMDVRPEGMSDAVSGLSLFSGPTPVWIEMPATAAEKSKLLDDIAEGRGRLRDQAKRYEPVAKHVGAMRSFTLSTADIVQDSLNQPRAAELERLQKLDRSAPGKHLYFPLDGRKVSMVVAVDSVTGELVDYFDLMPWHAAEIAQQRAIPRAGGTAASSPQTAPDAPAE